MSEPPHPAPPAPSYAERRRKATLRELLDDLIGYTREVTRKARTMTDAELEYAHKRLEWMADEVWREAVEAGRRDA
ncbi:MAG TPA: hypothetical protein VEA99_20710 [Gemmatimonadaceae bacterium]|nr:hypothetical protein [Gemmatimonadaceae bacterium]